MFMNQSRTWHDANTIRCDTILVVRRAGFGGVDAVYSCRDLFWVMDGK